MTQTHTNSHTHRHTHTNTHTNSHTHTHTHTHTYTETNRNSGPKTDMSSQTNIPIRSSQYRPTTWDTRFQEFRLRAVHPIISICKSCFMYHPNADITLTVYMNEPMVPGYTLFSSAGGAL